MRFTAVVAGMLLCCSLVAGTAAADRDVVVAPEATEVPLVASARIVADRDGRLTADDLLALPPDAGIASESTMASFGFTGTTYWFSLSLTNPAAAPQHRLLAFEPTWLDDVEVTLVGADGSRRVFRGGDARPFGERALSHRQINFELDLPPGRSRLLVRTQTRDPFLVAMSLWERGAFYHADADEALYFGTLYGAMAALLLFNLVLFFSVRERIYAAYVTYLGAFFAAHATYNGHAYGLFWPDAPAWANWAHSTFIYLFLLAGLFFTISFLELRSLMPSAYRQARGFFAVMLAAFAASALVGGYHLHVASSILWVVVYSPFVLWLGVRSFRAGNRAARYFLTATAAGFIGSFVTAVTVAGFIPFSFYTYRAVDIGMLVDAILLSLALADRLRIARAEADRAKAELIEAGRSYARQLEETVAQRTHELSEANAIKDKFFGIVAHDLRGPVGALSGLFNEVVTSRDDLSDEMLEVVRTTTLSTKNFLEELLTWARSQRGELDCHPVAVDMRRMLAETAELFAAQARAKGIELDLEIDDECWVYADISMAHTILRNLTHNALKFTDSGGTVRAHLSREAGRCRVSIADTGTGMPAIIRDNIFRLDVRPQSSPGTRNESGTGLGLILCREFAERNGGTVGVESEAGKGSTFWFTLPLAADEKILDLRAMLANARALKILVAEDDKLHRDAAVRILREIGCTPAFAADGLEAIRLASAGDFDLILMDIDMPALDGIEATRRLRAAGCRSSIVALSSYSRKELDRIAGDVRFDEYLYKPLAREDALMLLLAHPAAAARRTA